MKGEEVEEVLCCVALYYDGVGFENTAKNE